MIFVQNIPNPTLRTISESHLSSQDITNQLPGVVKFAQVVGVFPGPRFDDAEGAEAGEADVELLGWEE